jgi:hypothetical protein
MAKGPIAPHSNISNGLCFPTRDKSLCFALRFQGHCGGTTTLDRLKSTSRCKQEEEAGSIKTAG